MKEMEPDRPSYEQTHDYTVQPRDKPWANGTFHVRIFEQTGAAPVVVAERLNDERQLGVSGLTMCLAADVLQRHFMRRFWEDCPMRWIASGVRIRHRKGREINERHYWEVHFKSFVPRRVRLFSDTIDQIDEAGRRPCTLNELQKDLRINLGVVDAAAPTRRTSRHPSGATPLPPRSPRLSLCSGRPPPPQCGFATLEKISARLEPVMSPKYPLDSTDCWSERSATEHWTALAMK